MTITSPFESGLLRPSAEAVLRDYRIAVRSRHVSVLGRQEVLSGRAKFGIFGDGKEVCQLAMCYAFKKGDHRAGYYRDQTMMFALGTMTAEQFFAQLYAHADLEAEPAFGGRAMTGHFATRYLDEAGHWRPQLDAYNSTADLSPTAAQMPRLVGLGYASKLYRELDGLVQHAASFSSRGDEIAFGTIGNASCAEGLFWEAINAIGVLKVPVLMSIWDDGYGISVPNRFQMTKGSVSKALAGFRRRAPGRPGIDLHTVAGWDYPRLCETYLRAADTCRRDHVPTVVHVRELTQPLGHSTSGSHERYKSPRRLAWESEFDCIRKMRAWMLADDLATDEELQRIEGEERDDVSEAKRRAYDAYRETIDEDQRQLVAILTELSEESARPELADSIATLERRQSPWRRDLLTAAHEALVTVRSEVSLQESEARRRLARWRSERLDESRERYGSDLYSESDSSALLVPALEPRYDEDAPVVNGYEILNACFDINFARRPHLIALGEDVGQLGAVNQGFQHLQEKYGELRVSDTGIREATILGQAIGMAMRGLRPIAEVQYLDYILYALQTMSDDLATLRWRTRGGQKAPVIIRTRGHRLEGIWHSGSPMAGVINLIRGIYVCVPRDATRAAGFYNTLLRGDDPGLIVEVLNAYRKKGRLPSNVGEFTVPLGYPEILRAGSDLTIVTYGACCELAVQAAEKLSAVGVEAEVVDVQTLLPFDRAGLILESLKRTNRILFVDEDVPGGTTAYMMQQVLETQGGYDWLDGTPRTLPAAEHRPPYGSDGDYFAKPNRESIFAAAYEMMHEADPQRFPALF